MTDKPKPQIDKFKDAARKLKTDESEEHFDEKLRRVAKMPMPNAELRPKPSKR